MSLQKEAATESQPLYPNIRVFSVTQLQALVPFHLRAIDRALRTSPHVEVRQTSTVHREDLAIESEKGWFSTPNWSAETSRDSRMHIIDIYTEEGYEYQIKKGKGTFIVSNSLTVDVSPKIKYNNNLIATRLFDLVLLRITQGETAYQTAKTQLKLP